MENLAGAIEAPYIASARYDLGQGASIETDELLGAIVVPEDLTRGVDAPDFVGVAIVLVAYADRITAAPTPG